MYVSTNPQCGSRAVCIPLVTCLLLIKLHLTRAEMTKKRLVCAKDVHDWSCFMPWRHMYSRWRNLPIASQYSLSLFISWCFLVHLTVVQVILVPPQQYFLFSLSFPSSPSLPLGLCRETRMQKPVASHCNLWQLPCVFSWLCFAAGLSLIICSFATAT